MSQWMALSDWADPVRKWESPRGGDPKILLSSGDAAVKGGSELPESEAVTQEMRGCSADWAWRRTTLGQAGCWHSICGSKESGPYGGDTAYSGS